MILLTGATGFIGSALCAELVARGTPFRAAVRTAPAHTLPHVVVGEIGSVTDWAEALEGVHAVIHLAGRAHGTRRGRASEARQYFEVNDIGTGRLADAAASSGVERFIYLSTVKVNGETSPPEGFTERDPAAPRGVYAESKYAGELRIRSTDLPFTIVRTPLVYGPGVKANFLSLLTAVARGIPLPLGGVTSNRRSMISVRNLVDALLHVCSHPRAAGETFFVADGEPLSTRSLIEQIGAAFDRRVRLLSVPIPLLRAGGVLIGRSEQLGSVIGTLVVDITRIQEVTSWRPPQSTTAGLGETVAWYRGIMSPRFPR